MRLITGLICVAVWMSALGVPGLEAQEARYEWQEQQARVLPTGDLQWAPRQFEFRAGDSVRYIDFEAGNDANDGTTRESAWKHHPGDPQATGRAKAGDGAHTFVFKRGVTYRGSIVLRHSGTPEDPVRLTSDPEWGQGEAVICGSEVVTGWQKGATHEDIPGADQVWYTDLDFAPRNVWTVAEDGKVTRIPIARTPNWTVSDPEDVMSEWYEWEQPQWWERERHKTTVGGKKMHQGTDTENLTKDADYYRDALVWTEWGIVMGTPFPTQVEAVNTRKRTLAFQGIWWGDTGVIITGNRYYLEDKPHYLDAPGEHWFEKKGQGGRLYIRLPEDRDPRSVRIEAARRYSLVQDVAAARAPRRMDVIGEEGRANVNTQGVEHVEITGLSFQFQNRWWELWAPEWQHKEVYPAAIRLRGSCDDVRISNCRFTHVYQGVQVEPINSKTSTGEMAVTDNEIRETDDAAIRFSEGGGSHLRHVDVLRNRLHRIGLRPSRQSSAHALTVSFPDTMHVAGNILSRCYGAGVFLFGGKGSGRGGDVPLARYLVHQNRAEQTLLRANDWGGIEAWQGGPFYIYNNLSANPNGYWNWKGNRLGYAYYLDGGFKNYCFNNIAWGANNDPDSKLCNQSAINEAVPTIHNWWVNNTFYRFAKGANWSPRGGHHRYLGNVWDDISQTVFTLGRLKEDTSAAAREYPHELMGFAGNVFYDVGKLGHFENLVPEEEKMHESFESFQAALQKRQALAASLGVKAQRPPLRDPAGRDMRPSDGSAAIDQGVKFFVPWALYGMVGEWNFYPLGNDPSTIPDEHWYMTDYYRNRATYHTMPQYPLSVVNATEDSYMEGPLEDWARGALRFNGTDRYAFIEHEAMSKPVEYQVREGRGRRARTRRVEAAAADLKNPDIHQTNFLLEVYFRTEPGHAGGTLARKMDGAGYSLSVDDSGRVHLVVSGDGTTFALTSQSAVNDGEWHHVIAECDREDREMRIYVDGREDSTGDGAGPDANLSNAGDFLVGGTPDGAYLAGAIDFLRVCHGTLADARTSIDELYTWQFDGPFLRDFTGRKPQGSRDAGAIEGGSQ